MRQHFPDISILRVFLIVLLVLYHAFVPYIGEWEQPKSFEENTFYWWIAKFSYSFMLEMFVFISGFCFYLSKKTHAYSFGELCRNKFSRLIIPSLVFSFLYVLLVKEYRFSNVIDVIYTIITGAGHMWFLPMLFLITLMAFGLDELRVSFKCKIFLVGISPVLSLFPLFLRLKEALYYFPFFFVGMMVFKYIEKIRFYFSWRLCFCFLFLYLISFIFFWGGV